MHGRTGSQHNIMSQSHTYTIPVSSLFDPLLARLIHQPYMKHLLLIILKTCVGMKHDATATPCCETITCAAMDTACVIVVQYNSFPYARLNCMFVVYSLLLLYIQLVFSPKYTVGLIP